MALQIRRAHRSLHSLQDQIGLRTSNRTSRGKVPGTFPVLRELTQRPLTLVPAVKSAVFLWLSVLTLTGCAGSDKWIIYKLDETKSPTALFMGHKEFKESETGPEVDKLEQISRTKEKDLDSGKPIVDERDDSQVVIYLPTQYPAKCTIDEKPFNQPDAAVVPKTPTGARDLSVNALDARAPGLPFVCHLNVRGKGGTEFSYKIVKVGQGGSSDELKLQDSIRVHALYRFRIMAGPVYTSLSKKTKSYSLQPTSAGNKVVTSSDASEGPVNYPLFLKIYWTPRGRDILVDPPSCFESWRCLERINPIVGINLVDHPLQHFYTGLSFEPVRGVDIVGGAHWAKVQELTGGFSENQETTADSLPTKHKFKGGWFAGVTVDVGVATAWLTNSLIQGIKSLKN